MGQSALDYRNYKLAGVTISSASELYFDGAKDTVRINLPEGYVKVSGKRLLEVVNVTDKDGNTLKKDKNSAEVDLVENVKPVAEEVEIKDAQNIIVTFSEKLDALPTGGVEGVKAKIGTVEVELDDTTPFVLADNKLTITAKAIDAFKLTDPVSVEFKSANLVDLAGNAVKDGTVTVK